MTNMDNRIKLAKAMGAEFATIDNGLWAQVNLPNGRVLADWNPLTDANDDYAVLGWLRTEFTTMPAASQLLPGVKAAYQIGDYARAALKILDGQT